MVSMTTKSASVCPYSVFVDVPQRCFGLISIKDDNQFVNRSVPANQFDAYNDGESRIKSSLASIFTSMLAWVIPFTVTLVFTLDAIAERNITRFIWVLAVDAGLILATVVSSRYLRRRQKHYDRITEGLDGQIVTTPCDHHAHDLHRIQAALDKLQAAHGTAYDEQAREAVAAVLDQNVHQPSQKHLLISESKAEDSSSKAIRIRTFEAKNQWSQDVAKAEHLVLGLEEAAGKKTPVTA